ncbi:hypothetical protein [Companilactobacillus keshanensis]|uniref:Surface layer protein A domain-containing protein n=1 Tax=Companilactobacillus keshanensis TaxID=2486003 RepID=A0ABW4BSZ8_9LACO|nr:hypothetical protein [Companilactobacillus keshanensis]
MKKSIKYAGVAAATLLAVAPVAAPVLSSSVTTVQAAADKDTTSTVQNAASSYLNNLKSSTTVAAAADLPDLSTLLATATNGTATVPFNTYSDSDVYKLNTANATNDANLNLTNNVSNVTLSGISAVTTAGATRSISNKADYDKAVAEGLKSVTLTVGIGSFGTEAGDDGVTTITPSPATATVTYSVKDDTTSTDTIKTGAVSYDKSYDVDFGSSTVAPQYSSTTNFAAKDADGKTISAASATPDTNYYATKYDALTALNGGAHNAVTLDGTFDKADTTYYQIVNVAVTGDLATLLDNYTDKTTNANNTYKVTANDSDLSSLVSSKDVKLDVTSATTGSTATPATATFSYVRAINVGSEEAANWTVKDESGVVTTKTDKTYYTMKNDDNNTISNRALAANTSWQYDQTRTDKDGNVQYRVSTHEWVPAESVTVNDNNGGGTTDPDGALTVTNLDTKKVLNLATPGMTYFLYNKDGKMSDTRALAGGTSWLVDKTATDAAGNTYYGVSTNEFVKAGEGVSLAD